MADFKALAQRFLVIFLEASAPSRSPQPILEPGPDQRSWQLRRQAGLPGMRPHQEGYLLSFPCAGQPVGNEDLSPGNKELKGEQAPMTKQAQCWCSADRILRNSSLLQPLEEAAITSVLQMRTRRRRGVATSSCVALLGFEL